MDFTISPQIRALAARTRAFVREEIIPLERDPRWGAHGPDEDLRAEMNARARAAGLFAPHAPQDLGGLGLNMVARAFVFEEAGYSMLGPVAMHCAAPDEGNMHLLDALATPVQRARHLAPLAAGARSCFAMTEPDGAGSDPGQLATVAEHCADGYAISGRKWFITGAAGARVMILMARMRGGPHDGAATMFVTDLPRAGIRILRQQDAMDSSFAGGHAEIAFERLMLGEDDILGAPGKGFEHAQLRLAPARLTHCMRWLGSARRAQDIAAAHAARRTAFGRPLAEHEGVGFALADSAMEIHAARLVLLHACWVLDQGGRGTTESSMAKVQCSETVWRAVDRAVQILGGMGTTEDTIVARIFRDVRAFRIYDGPSEVHRWSLGRKAVRAAAAGTAIPDWP
ncbi:MAG: acyl-CoA dehydrogenase family protein [Roseovarius sp.]